MTNVDNFKSFVKKNPHLITHVRNGNMTWQKFYEIYDLYGEDEKVWEEYQINNRKEEVKKVSKTPSTFSSIIEMAKNIDTDKLQDGITSIQKAISLFGDMLVKDDAESKETYTPRPIYRKFDD